MTNLILESKGNVKQLYSIFNKLTAKKKDNPMPPDKTDVELAEIFSYFFYDKIITIWKSLEKTRIYIPTEDRQISTMKQFDLCTEGQIRKLILSMPSKSCELDVIPTKLLKKPKVLDVLLPNICDIMNTSLSEGTFGKTCSATVQHSLQ